MDGEYQPATSHISVMDTPLDHAQDEAMPLVEWALTPMGYCWPKEEYASIIVSIIHLDILCFVTGDPLLWPPNTVYIFSTPCQGRVDSTSGLAPKEEVPRELSPAL